MRQAVQLDTRLRCAEAQAPESPLLATLPSAPLRTDEAAGLPGSRKLIMVLASS
jgi:hypothetical protein